jgi:hypothetical protein
MGGMSTPEPLHALPVPARRQRNAGHVVAIVVGCLTLLAAGSALAGATAIAVAQAASTDDDGYFTATLDRVSSDGVAVATSDTWFDGDDFDDGETWVLDWVDLDVRLRVDGAGAGDDVFVGIARTDDVEAYLDGNAYSLVEDIDARTPQYRQVTGSGSADAPTEQDFWVAAADGSGEQEITWNARGGRWTAIVMNADGSPDVSADVELGARSDAVTPIMVTLFVGGGIALLTAGALIGWGARGRRTDTPVPGSGPSATPPAATNPEPYPTPVG